MESLRRVERSVAASARKSRDSYVLDAFEVLLDPTTDLVYLNYAVPLEGKAPTRSLLEELCHCFREHGRQPRFEFTRELWGDLELLLQDCGFELEDSHPMMICPTEEFVPQFSNEIEVELLNEASDLAAFYEVANEAFDMKMPLEGERIERNRRDLRSGALRLAMGRVNGHDAGSAASMPYDGVTELAGVGTRAKYRRMGVASAVSSVLLGDHFRSGDLAWLSAGSDAAKSVYERLGFRTVATHVNYRFRQ